MTTDIITIILCISTVTGWFLWFYFVVFPNTEWGYKVKRSFSQLSKHELMKSLVDITVAWFFGLFIPIAVYIQAVYTLTFLDFVIGVTAAVQLQEKFSWRKASTIITKFVAWGGLLAAVVQIQNLLKIPSVTIGELEFSAVLAVAGVIAWAETKSIFRNVKGAFGLDIGSFLGRFFPQTKAFDVDNEQKSDDKQPIS